MEDILRFTSRSVADVEETWQRFVPSARLNRVDPDRFGFDWTSITIPGLSVVSYDLTASVRSSIHLDGQLMACRLSADGASLWTDHGAISGGSPWVAGDHPTHAAWDGTARVRAFVFDHADAEDVARRVSGDEGLVLRMDDASPKTVAMGRQWETAYRYVISSLMGLAAGGGPIDPLIAAELRRHSILATLTAFPSTFSDAAERAAQTRAAPALVRRAIAFIESHAHEPLTIDDIAHAVGISTRGLQYAFRRALDSTPTEHLRRVRLSGAHDDLRVGGGSVVTVARRWGFHDPSRFAKYYRAAYGVNPSDTARTA